MHFYGRYYCARIMHIIILQRYNYDRPGRIVTRRPFRSRRPAGRWRKIQSNQFPNDIIPTRAGRAGPHLHVPVQLHNKIFIPPPHPPPTICRVRHGRHVTHDRGGAVVPLQRPSYFRGCIKSANSIWPLLIIPTAVIRVRIILLLCTHCRVELITLPSPRLLFGFRRRRAHNIICIIYRT